MTRIVQRARVHCRGYSFSLAVALTCGLATIASAEVHVEGNTTAVRVTTGQDTINDVLSALAAVFNVQYRTAIPLEAAAGKTYSGSFGRVIYRLLDGYNYVIKKDQETIEIVVFGRSGSATIPAQAITPLPTKGVLSRWR